MIILLITGIATISISLVSASMAMNATLWLVGQVKGQGLAVVGAREFEVAELPLNVIAFEPVAIRTARAA